MNPEDETAYSLEIVARLSGVDAELVMRYREEGLIRPITGSDDCFDDEAVRTLRRIEHLRSAYGVNENGVRLILGLLEDVELLRGEIRRH